jgi:hypothetical protein
MTLFLGRLLSGQDVPDVIGSKGWNDGKSGYRIWTYRKSDIAIAPKSISDIPIFDMSIL